MHMHTGTLIPISYVVCVVLPDCQSQACTTLQGIADDMGAIGGGAMPCTEQSLTAVGTTGSMPCLQIYPASPDPEPLGWCTHCS